VRVRVRASGGEPLDNCQCGASPAAVLTLLIYFILYTPLKRRTPLCTLVGALSGGHAATDRMGCSLGEVELRGMDALHHALPLAFPHFMAIAWMYREDYERAGYLVLPRGKRRIRFMAWQSMLPALALIPVSLVPRALGLPSCLHGGSFAAGLVLLLLQRTLAVRKSNADARRLLLPSIIYLPVVFVLMVLNKT